MCRTSVRKECRLPSPPPDLSTSYGLLLLAQLHTRKQDLLKATNTQGPNRIEKGMTDALLLRPTTTTDGSLSYLIHGHLLEKKKSVKKVFQWLTSVVTQNTTIESLKCVCIGGIIGMCKHP